MTFLERLYGLIPLAIVLFWMTALGVFSVKAFKKYMLREWGQAIIYSLIVLCVIAAIEWILFAAFLASCWLTNLGCAAIN